MISKWPLLSMGGVLRGIAASTYSKYASTPIPCAAEPINKIDALKNQKQQLLINEGKAYIIKNDIYAFCHSNAMRYALI